MIHEKIESAHNALAELAGKVPEEQWKLVALVRAELRDAMQQVACMEEALTIDEALTADLTRDFLRGFRAAPAMVPTMEAE